LEATKTELTAAKQRLAMIVSKLAQSMDERWQKHNNIESPEFDPMKLDNEVLTEMMETFVVKHHEYQESVAARAEELELQVTRMSMDLMRVSKKCLAYEIGLKELLQYPDLNAVKDRVYQLQVVAGEAYHSIDANDVGRQPEALFAIDGITERSDCDALRELGNANRLNLIPLTRKLPGDTLLRDLHPDLKLYIVRELSLEKSAGADWRTLALRVGVSQANIDEWTSLKLSNTAGQVLDAWIESVPMATIRLLHRHLASPSMRCTVICKRLSDFYEVS